MYIIIIIEFANLLAYSSTIVALNGKSMGGAEEMKKKQRQRGDSYGGAVSSNNVLRYMGPTMYVLRLTRTVHVCGLPNLDETPLGWDSLCIPSLHNISVKGTQNDY